MVRHKCLGLTQMAGNKDHPQVFSLTYGTRAILQRLNFKKEDLPPAVSPWGWDFSEWQSRHKKKPPEGGRKTGRLTRK